MKLFNKQIRLWEHDGNYAVSKTETFLGLQWTHELVNFDNYRSTGIIKTYNIGNRNEGSWILTDSKPLAEEVYQKLISEYEANLAAEKKTSSTKDLISKLKVVKKYP